MAMAGTTSEPSFGTKAIRLPELNMVMAASGYRVANLLFIPDKNGDDIPDGEPEVVLDGWTTEAKHNVFNGLKWGPDGWLYGCHGILATSHVGRPGTPDDKRVPLNCCIWRYHPTRKTFEVVCNGTTNPWGIDFNEYGEGFFTNCVIDHAFHMIPGATTSGCMAKISIPTSTN